MYTKYFKIALLVFSLSVNQSYCAKIGSNNERDVNGSFVDEYEMESFLRSLTDNANGTDGSITNEVIRRWPKRVIQRMQELIQGKQMPPLSPNPIQSVTNRIPCTCKNGLCGCCTGGMLAYFNSKGCMKLKYIPEDFSFEFKMMMNDVTLYKNKVSGKNPRPICVHPPRFDIIQICAGFHDIYFVGRNMHICLDITANFEGYELFERQFDCMRMGSDGVKIVKPEDGGGLPGAPGGVEADIDAGGPDEIGEYDEVVG